MNNVLRENLTIFKNITLSIIEELRKEEYDHLDDLISSRDEVIKKLSSLEHSSIEFRTISEELQLMTLEEKLTKLLSEKKNKVRVEIDKVNTIKKANNNYQRNFHSDSLFFNKKI